MRDAHLSLGTIKHAVGQMGTQMLVCLLLCT